MSYDMNIYKCMYVLYIYYIHNIHVCVYAQLLSHVWLFANPWTAACQAPLSMRFYQQEYWSGLPFHPPTHNKYYVLWIPMNIHYIYTINTIILFTDGSQIPETLTLSYQPAGVGTSTLLPSDRLTGCENWWQARENPCFWSWAHGVGVPRPGQTADEHVFLGGRSWIWA